MGRRVGGTRRRWAVAAAVAGLLAGPVVVAPLAGAAPPTSEAGGGYVVLYREGTSAGAARAAVAAAGGRVVSENEQLGVALVRSSRSDFVLAAAAQPALAGAARDQPMWQEPRPPSGPPDVGVAGTGELAAGPAPAPVTAGPVEADPAAAEPAPAPVAAAPAAAPTAEPLAGLQWDMSMIGASDAGAFATGQGSPDVLVGVIDTGIDASHPDLAPVVDLGLSRNFTTDDPSIDGPCEAEPDRSCDDPVDVDEAGHGTHVAGTIGAALNGIGTAGVAPGVRLANLRAGQDSGYFFLKPTLDALTYAADNGFDVVNMSFFTDPWLFNCPSNPADSAEEQVEQRTVVDATQRAVDYAWSRGVTMVAALGNEHTDLDRPAVDAISPDLPPGGGRSRVVDDSCIKVPTELTHVLGVTALGPTGKKADYSNYGLDAADLAAPGGFYRDFTGTPAANRFANEVLAPYPLAALAEQGLLDEAGLARTPDVVRRCTADACAYWRWLEGTSMAAPHVAGVAALVVSRLGRHDDEHGGLTLDPAQVESVLRASARDMPCPSAVVSYAAEGRPAGYDARCDGDAARNGIYGDGLVDAAAASAVAAVEARAGAFAAVSAVAAAGPAPRRADPAAR